MPGFKINGMVRGENQVDQDESLFACLYGMDVGRSDQKEIAGFQRNYRAVDGLPPFAGFDQGDFGAIVCMK